ncbi:WXG100 family type VII secretion target [Actinomadura rayongensis]|uniref:WXG100 family type VII secretion target n=1 Tax=Actinomadura rayongensis TaxID=1429076 RepID=A0A6I4W1M3_9ACTN|nr:hypothetical protein [Actinomadura rayongensis]MXQ63208.1 hypothetical protein [Actinomadura rayongensis]
MTAPRPGRHRMTASKKWPSKAGTIVDIGISTVEVLGAKKALDAAKRMKGDPEAILRVADKWRAAAQSVKDAEEPLFNAWNSLTADWTGGAYDAFRWHMTRNASVADLNAASLFAAEGALLDLALEVTNAYNLAVDLTTLAAGRIEPALSGLTWTSNKKADKPTISRALLDYVEAVNKVDTSLRTTLMTTKVGLARFKAELSKFRSPAEFPDGAGDPKRWLPK